MLLFYICNKRTIEWISYLTSCKGDHNVDKRSTERLGFISCEYNDMNLEKIYILNHFKITFTRLVIFKMDNSTSGRLNV